MLVRITAGILFVLISPILLLLYILVKTTSAGPFIFKQLRAGKDKKPFYIYKIRTMINNAEKLKTKYFHLNEVDPPVFKIRNDPRYTRVGKILSHLALDEVPQLINIIKGEMSFVGPRPLPLNEAQHISKKYNLRFSVLPGITSPWVVKGSHRLTFREWMKLDIQYVKTRNIVYDIIISAQTIWFIMRSILKLS